MNETSRETTITVEIVSATPNDDVAMSRHPPPRAAAAAPICIVCGHHAPDVRKLKTHLLLKHPNIHLCLFCVEKKGWSDDFASQAQYNQHYREHHDGSIANSEKRREELRAAKREWRRRRGEAARNGETPPKRPKPKDRCFLCLDKPEFASGQEFDRHLISVHYYDYCKLCNLIGNSATVRYHIGDLHADNLCHVCLGASPLFSSADSLRYHLVRAHSFSRRCGGAGNDAFPCLDCPEDEKKSFASRKEYQAHLLERHLTPGDVLRPMRKRRSTAEVILAKEEAKTKQSENSLLHRVSPIRNDSGQDCFIVSVIHLLAQTDLLEVMGGPVQSHQDCPEGSCMLSYLLDQYQNGTRRAPGLSVARISSNMSRFGVDSAAADVGDFLRAALHTAATATADHGARDGEKSVADLFTLSLIWRFECGSCNRFTHSSYRDNVLRLDGGRAGEASLQQMLDTFLNKKRCHCGQVSEVPPGVKQAGKYICVEVDRAIKSEDDSKELNIYSLQLKQSYNIFGFCYALVGTVSYLLEAEEGGHYLTRLFPRDNWGILNGGNESLSFASRECVQVHETEVKTARKRPDFDADVVIVLLEKVSESSRGERSDMNLVVPPTELS